MTSTFLDSRAAGALVVVALRKAPPPIYSLGCFVVMKVEEVEVVAVAAAATAISGVQHFLNRHDNGFTLA